jgi:phosphoserine phosphatase
MVFVATAIAASTLPPDATVAVHQHMQQILGCSDGPVSWLHAAIAFDCALPVYPGPEAIRQLRKVLMPWRVDVLISAVATRQKKLLLADMDSTIVVGETLDDLAAHVGLGDQVAAITASAMNGELDFAQALAARVRLLAGMPVYLIDMVVNHTRLMPGAKTLVHTMKAHGAHTVLISGGFTRFTQVVATQCGFDQHVGNVLAVENDQLTGETLPPLVDKHTKLNMLLDTVANLTIAVTDVLAVGDGANDIPMLMHAGLGVGYQPKPVVAQAVDNVIMHNDLTALLYAQGYPPEQWVNWE